LCGVAEASIAKIYWDFLSSSPKPIAVQFLKRLLDNQLGPEKQWIVVMDNVRESAVKGRAVTIFNILSSAEKLMQNIPTTPMKT